MYVSYRVIGQICSPVAAILDFRMTQKCKLCKGTFNYYLGESKFLYYSEMGCTLFSKSVLC